MIGQDGKPLTREMIRAAVATYAKGERGAKEFAALPRALVTVLDHLTIGKTTYLKGVDGQVQVLKRKDSSLTVT